MATEKSKSAYIRLEVDGRKPVTRDVRSAALIRVAAKDWSDNREVTVEIQTVKGYPVIYVSVTRDAQPGARPAETIKLEMN